MMPQEGLRDIRGPVALFDPTWLIVGVILLALAAVVGWMIFRRRQALRPPVSEPLPHPGETALKALERLGQMPLQGADAVKLYYSALSGIIRTYIEARFNIRAPEMTSDEFMEAARRSPALTAAQQTFLLEFLQASDMVKFARACPIPSDMKTARELAVTFVRETWN